MPMKLRSIQEPVAPREITLDFGDAGTIEMTVLPDKFTLGRQRKIKAAIKDNDTAAIADALFEVVQSWDLEGDDGEPLPLDQSGIDQLKLETATAIANKMAESLGGPKAGTSNA